MPDAITLLGEGVFPCIGFNLPCQLTDPSHTQYASIREKAVDVLKAKEKKGRTFFMDEGGQVGK